MGTASAARVVANGRRVLRPAEFDATRSDCVDYCRRRDVADWILGREARASSTRLSTLCDDFFFFSFSVIYIYLFLFI